MSLYWQEHGDPTAPTVVFLHGFGVSSWMWLEQVEALHPHYHCLIVDLPGNGKSHTLEWLSLKDAAEQIATLIRAHGTQGKAHVVGLSLGGFVAITLLENHPDVVESVLVSGVSATPLRVSWLTKGLLRLIPTLMRWEPFVKLQARLLQLPPEATPAFVQDNKVLTPMTYQRVYGEIFPFQLPRTLAERPHRFLAVAGEKEVRDILTDLSEFPRILPNGVAKIAPKVHHGWNGENPLLFNAMIQAWLAEQPLPAELMDGGGVAVSPSTTHPSIS